MDIRNNSNLSFQARIPKEVKNQILDTALDYGTKSIKNAKRQIRNIENWGSPDYVLGKRNFRSKDCFVLSKEGSGTFLPKRKNSLFGSFMSIRKSDILDAEKEISNPVSPLDISMLDRFM